MSVAHPQRSAEAIVADLEELCGRSERAMRGPLWEQLDRVAAVQRLLTCELAAAFERQPGGRATTGADLLQRLRMVYAIRENHLLRLRECRRRVAGRLAAIAASRSALRALAQRTPRRTLGLNQLR